MAPIFSFSLAILIILAATITLPIITLPFVLLLAVLQWVKVPRNTLENTLTSITGIPDMPYSTAGVVTGLIQHGNSIFLSIIISLNAYTVYEYSGNDWAPILELDSFILFESSSSLGIFNNSLFSVVGPVGTYKSCNGLPINDSLAYYKDGCWTGFEVPYGNVLYLSSSDSAGKLCIIFNSENVIFLEFSMNFR